MRVGGIVTVVENFHRHIAEVLLTHGGEKCFHTSGIVGVLVDKRLDGLPVATGFFQINIKFAISVAVIESGFISLAD